MLTIFSYAGYAGVGINTLSPLFISAVKIVNMASLPPTVIHISSAE